MKHPIDEKKMTLGEWFFYLGFSVLTCLVLIVLFGLGGCASVERPYNNPARLTLRHNYMMR